MLHSTRTRAFALLPRSTPLSTRAARRGARERVDRDSLPRGARGETKRARTARGGVARARASACER